MGSQLQGNKFRRKYIEYRYIYIIYVYCYAGATTYKWNYKVNTIDEDKRD